MGGRLWREMPTFAKSLFQRLTAARKAVQLESNRDDHFILATPIFGAKIIQLFLKKMALIIFRRNFFSASKKLGSFRSRETPAMTFLEKMNGKSDYYFIHPSFSAAAA